MLYRPEAIEHATRRLPGDVSLAVPFRAVTVGAIMSAAVALAIVVASSTSYARKETVSGWIVPSKGMARVTARSDGVVDRVDVRQGERVQAGEALALIRLQALSPSEAMAKALQSQEQASGDAQVAGVERLQAQRAHLSLKKASMVHEVTLANDRIRVQEQVFAVARAAVKRSEDLRQRGFVPQRDLENRTTEALMHEEALIASRANLSSLERQLLEITGQEKELGAQIAILRSDAAAKFAAIDQQKVEHALRREFLATAPAAGAVAAISAFPGQEVRAGSTLALVVPDGSTMEAELYVPSRAAGNIRAGQAVKLMYEAFPYQRYGAQSGRVVSVSNAALAPQDLPVSVIDPREPMFRVTVALDRDYVEARGRRTTIAPGQAVMADIVIERRSIIQWLLDPLYAVQRKAAV